MNIETKTIDDLRKENDILDAAYELLYKKFECKEFVGFINEQDEIEKTLDRLCILVNILKVKNKSQAYDINFGERGNQ